MNYVAIMAWTGDGRVAKFRDQFASLADAEDHVREHADRYPDAFAAPSPGTSIRDWSVDPVAGTVSLLPRPEDFVERVADAKQRISVEADKVAVQLVGPVPQHERDSWPDKARAAREHLAGSATAADTALLQGELDTAGLDANMDALSGKIVANANAYTVLAGKLAGMRRKATAAIEALDNPSQLEVDDVLTIMRAEGALLVAAA